MTKKKNSSPMKKLIPAAGMLMVSAMMLASSTYAWFSMNKAVTATGMQLTAKTNNTYLLISQTNTTASTIQSEGLTTQALTVADADAKLFPSSPALEDAEVAYLTVAEGHKKVGGDAISTAGVKVTNPATAAVVTNWFTADALGPGAATIDTTTAKQLESFTGYVIQKTAYLTVASGSNGANNLTVTPTFAQKTGVEGTTPNDITAAKVVVTTSDGGFAVLSSTNNGTPIDIKGSNTTLTDSTVLTVNFYIYYDGDESPVYTNNMANLSGADFQCSFGVDAVLPS
jgi:hypothetical protein